MFQKVETKTSIKGKVLDYLNSNPTEDHNSYSIAKALDLNESSVRTALRRLYREGKIIWVKRGYYRARLELDDIVNWIHGDLKLHAPKIEARFPDNYSVEGGHTLVAQYKTRATEKSDTYVLEFDGRRITITIHKDGLVEIFNRCSKEPLGFLDFSRFLAYLEGVFPFFAVMDARLVQLGLNTDTRLLRLDGIKSLKLQIFANAWASLYQKTGQGLWTEVHVNPRDLQLSEALDILKSMVTTDEGKESGRPHTEISAGAEKANERRRNNERDKRRN